MQDQKLTTENLHFLPPHLSTPKKFPKILLGLFYLILILTMIGLFGVMWGCLWAVGDLFSEEKFATFLAASWQTKLFWIGFSLLGLFFISVVVYLFYIRHSPKLQRQLEKAYQFFTQSFHRPPVLIHSLIFCIIFDILIFCLGILGGIGELFLSNLIETEVGFLRYFINLSGGIRTMGISLAILGIAGVVYLLFYLITVVRIKLSEYILVHNLQYPHFSQLRTKSRFISVFVEFYTIFLIILIDGLIISGFWTIHLIYQDQVAVLTSSPLGFQITTGAFCIGIILGTVFLFCSYYQNFQSRIYRLLFIQISKPKSSSSKIVSAISRIAYIGILLVILGGFMGGLNYLSSLPQWKANFVTYATSTGSLALLFQILTLLLFIGTGTSCLFFWNNGWILWKNFVSRIISFFSRKSITPTSLKKNHGRNTK